MPLNYSLEQWSIDALFNGSKIFTISLNLFISFKIKGEEAIPKMNLFKKNLKMYYANSVFRTNLSL